VQLTAFDFDQPCGVLMMSVLHFVGGDIATLRLGRKV
jgi:hypothetical protein